MRKSRLAAGWCGGVAGLALGWAAGAGQEIGPRDPGVWLKRSVFAAPGQVHAPIALAVDEKGRVFVAETYRYEGRGVVDNRGKTRRELDDLQTGTLEDRRRVLTEWLESGELAPEQARHADLFGPGENLLTKFSEKVVLLEDADGDGAADRRTVFAEGFNDLLDGPGAGILTGGGAVYYACIPHLWKLEDSDGDGRAEKRTPLQRGFGVRAGWFGHDLHGLTWGPDGMLYFTVGDRGFHVPVPDGRVLHGPGTGAVFRCWPDGSGLEVYASGLRNPQELAFDAYGNLFTVDNNSDAGDLARVVWVVEGGDSGWDVSVQSLPARGPWMAERMWERPDAAAGVEPPDWVLPPVGHLADGPAGLAFYPGTGLPESYRDHLFLCDYRGGVGAILAFTVEAEGAGFRLGAAHAFDEGPAVSDLAFGPDGRLYVAEWGPGWDIHPGARIYTLEHPPSRGTRLVEEVGQLLGGGLASAGPEALTGLLGHADQRVRQGAQFALAERGAVKELEEVAAAGPASLLGRLHAVWGLGQAARGRAEALRGLLPLLSDPEPEIRAQVCRVLGERRLAEAGPGVLALLRDASPRVRFYAAIACGRIGTAGALGGLVDLLRENSDRDPWLRHAAVVGLTHLNEADALLGMKEYFSTPSVRLGVVLVLRRLYDPRVEQFLSDPSARVAAEAARAIYDQEMAAALPALAAVLDEADLSALPAALRTRAMEAGFRIGGEPEAERTVRLAVRPETPAELRSQALWSLLEWDSPPPREGVWGRWRPVEARPAGAARGAVRRHLAELRRIADSAHREIVVALEAKYGEEKPVEELERLIADPAAPANERLAALQSLERQEDVGAAVLRQAVSAALGVEGPPRLRGALRRVLARLDPESGADLLRETIESGLPAVERQEAVRVLPLLPGPAAEELLGTLLGRLESGNLPAELGLDVFEAAGQSSSAQVRSRVAAFAEGLRAEFGEAGLYRLSLSGGDPESGRRVFQANSATQCVRCHAVGGRGGRIGPPLDRIGERLPPEGLLRAVVDPQAEVVLGYGVVTATLADGEIVTGTLLRETPEEVSLQIDGEERALSRSRIREWIRPIGGMPPMGALLTPSELRDLVAYLGTLR